MIKKIEIDFPVPVELSDGFQQSLDELLTTVCKKYEADNPKRVMWPFGHGSKPTHIPLTQEDEKKRGCEFDDSVYYIEVAEREGHENELKRRWKERFINHLKKVYNLDDDISLAEYSSIDFDDIDAEDSPEDVADEHMTYWTD